jgi:AraC-like DNA-binding protein
MIQHLERFQTSSVKPSERLDFWNAVASSTYPGIRIDSQVDQFAAEMWRWRLGDLTMIRPRSPEASLQRQINVRDPSEGRVILHLQHRGHSLNRQGQRAAELGAGDFTLCDVRDRYATQLFGDTEMLVVEMPRTAIVERIPGFDDALCRTISGTMPGARLVHDFLLSLWRQGDQSAADPAWQAGIANVFLDLLAHAVKGADPRISASTALRDRVCAIVEQRLSDPELKAASIAEELGISVRTVHSNFAAMATTAGHYILQRRLVRASDRLSAQGDASITDIAFDLGFNDSAYFARCFRKCYGVSPREWRRQH